MFLSCTGSIGFILLHISLLVFQNQSKMSVIKTTIDVTFKKASEPRKLLLGMGLMIQHLGSRRFKRAVIV